MEQAIAGWKGLVDARSAYERLSGMLASTPRDEAVTELPAPAGALSAELSQVLSAAAQANNASLHRDGDEWTAQGDPTEAALLVAARKGGIDGDALEQRLPRIAEVPFSSERKLMSTVHRDARSDSADGIACWFIDTEYNEESFFVRHAYFLGADDPYKALKTTLRAEIDEDAWATLRSDVSRPFDKPETGRIAVKVINHLGDEVMKVFRVA